MTDEMMAIVEERTNFFFSKVSPRELLEIRSKDSFSEFICIGSDGIMDSYRVYGSDPEDFIIV